MKKIIISVVSHLHFNYIFQNIFLKEIAKIKNVEVVIKDNCHDKRLELYSKQNKYHYLVTKEVLGFGCNNNVIFEYAKKNLAAKNDDWFIILNPDVNISVHEFSKLIDELNSSDSHFFAPNLFKDGALTIPENSIRKFASYSDLLNPLKLKSINTAYDKSLLSDKTVVDWASGAFLCITFSSFEAVKGFDKRYFMYYEDVDLCYRLNQQGIKLRFLKNVKAVHKGEYKNRSVFSKHFRWYLSSLFKFLKVQSSNGS